VNHPGSPATAGWQHNAAFNNGVPHRTANLSGATQNRALNNAAQRNNYRGFDGNAVGRNNGGVQNQPLDQRRQQAASVMNSRPGFTSGQTHASPRSVPPARQGVASDSHHISGRQLPQHNSPSHPSFSGQQALSQRSGNLRQGGDMTRSSAFSGNSSRGPSWQQQQARGDRSRHQMRDSLPERSAGAEAHHFQRR